MSETADYNKSATPTAHHAAHESGGSDEVVGTVLRDGTKTLTADWDIGDTRKILTDGIRARDAAGLLLQDDGGNGITVADGGDVTLSHQLSIAGASRVRGTKTTAQTIASGTNTTVQWNSKDFDNLNEFDNVTNYRFTASKAGYYMFSALLLSANVAWVDGALWYLILLKNGALIYRGFRHVNTAAETMYYSAILHDILYLAVNDYVEFQILHNRGSDTNTFNSGEHNHFVIHRLS